MGSHGKRCLYQMLGCLPCRCMGDAWHAPDRSTLTDETRAYHGILHIKVQWALSGEVLTNLDTLKASDTVFTLRQAVQQAASLPPGTRLFLAKDTSLLQDCDTLFAAGVHDGIALQVIVENVAMLVGCDDGTAALIDGRTGATNVSFFGHTKAVRSIRCSEDGSLILTGSEDNTVAIWDSRTGERKRLLLGHTGKVSSVNFMFCNDRVLSGSYDKTARIWNASNEESVQVLRHPAQVAATAISSDSATIATGCQDHCVRLWSLVTSHEGYVTSHILEGHRGTIRSLAFCQDGQRLLSASFDSQIRLFDCGHGGSCQKTFQGHDRAVVCVFLSPNEDVFVSGSADGTARLWSLHSGFLRTLPRDGTQGSIFSVAFSEDGSAIATGSCNGVITLCDAQREDYYQIFKLDHGAVWSLSLVSRSRLL